MYKEKTVKIMVFDDEIFTIGSTHRFVIRRTGFDQIGTISRYEDNGMTMIVIHDGDGYGYENYYDVTELIGGYLVIE